MERSDAIAALAALAQEHRLETYRLLVQAGPDGISAGEVATAIGPAAAPTARQAAPGTNG